MSIIQHQYSLKQLNTFGIDVKTKLFADISSEDDLKVVFREDYKNLDYVYKESGGSFNDFDKIIDKIKAETKTTIDKIDKKKEQLKIFGYPFFINKDGSVNKNIFYKIDFQ